MRTDNFDFARYEQAAAAQARGMARDPISWEDILSAAQFAINDGLEFTLDHAVSNLLLPNPLPIVAASRMLVSSLRRASMTGDMETLDSQVRKELRLLAIGAFAMHGNFPSSEAVASQLLRDDGPLTPSEAVFVAVASPRHIGEVLRVTPKTEERPTIEQLASFLRNPSDTASIALRQSLRSVLARSHRPFEKVLVGIAVVVFEVCAHLSVASTLKRISASLPTGYLDKLLDDRILLLLPPQAAALEVDAVLSRTGNVLVSFPTSTGKTLVGELAIMSSVADGRGLGVYVAPYVALANQVYRSFRRRAPDSIRVQAEIGGYGSAGTLEPDRAGIIVVATPERFDTLLRNQPTLREHLRAVVVDEAHILGNDTRGLRLEGIISRLRMLQAKGASFRIICLSAVVGDPDPMITWLGRDDTIWTTTTWRPTARRLAYWAFDGQLHYLVGDDPVRRSNQSNTSIYASERLPWPEPDLYPPRNYGEHKAQQPRVYRNIAYLVESLLRQQRGSVLCVSATKAGTRGIAYRIADRLSDLEPIPETVGRTIGVIRQRYPYLSALATCLGRGVAYHNASLPHEVRQLIEEAAQSRELRAIVATTTLAEGVDLPFYFTVLSDWLTWSAEGQVLMDPLLFRNVAGRSGRAGYHTEGETIVFDNPVGDIRLTGSQVRRSNQRNVFLLESAPPLLSVLEQTNLADNPNMAATVEAQFMASIPENPTVENLPEAFAASSFAAARGANPAQMLEICSRIQRDLLDDTYEAFATAASPLTLTPLGVAANGTGLSPQSCRALLRELRQIGSTAEAGPELAASLVVSLAALPELGNDALRRKLLRVPRARYPVGAEDLVDLFDNWLKGAELEELFVRLAYVNRSSRRRTLGAWLEGNAPESSWFDDFDKFVDFMTGTVGSFLPWIVRSCAQLERHAGVALAVDWLTFADMLEIGVDSRFAVSAVRWSAPVSRRAVVVVGHYWPKEWPAEEQSFLWPRAQAGPEVAEVFDTVLGHVSEDGNLEREVRTFAEWYLRVPSES